MLYDRLQEIWQQQDHEYNRGRREYTALSKYLGTRDGVVLLYPGTRMPFHYDHTSQAWYVLLGLTIVTVYTMVTVANPGGPRGPCPPPWPVKNRPKKMAAVRGGLYFMFLGPPLSGVSGSATGLSCKAGPINIYHFQSNTVV